MKNSVFCAVSNLGIAMSVFNNLNLLPTKPWFTFDGSLTTGYATVQYPKKLGFPKICTSTDLIGSCLIVNDLGISSLFAISGFLFSNSWPTIITRPDIQPY